MLDSRRSDKSLSHDRFLLVPLSLAIPLFVVSTLGLLSFNLFGTRGALAFILGFSLVVSIPLDI
jgi:hypothetical protein